MNAVLMVPCSQCKRPFVCCICGWSRRKLKR